MPQSIEEQLEIMQAYADGQPVYCRPHHHDIGKMVEEKDHQFNFKDAFYSLTPLDWCTGKEAIDAYDTFMRYGSEHDQCPSQYGITLSVNEPITNKKKEFWKKAIDAVDTFSIFIAGAEWIIRNCGSGIDFHKSLDEMRKKGEYRQAELNAEEKIALHGH